MNVQRKRLTPLQNKKIACEQQWNCNICKELLQIASYPIDHIIPLQFGGTNDRNNLQALCSNCHAKKTERESLMAIEMKQEREEKSNVLKHIHNDIWTPNGKRIYLVELKGKPVRSDWIWVSEESIKNTSKFKQYWYQ